MNKKLKGLYAITDATLMGDNLLSMTEQAIRGGISLLQYRNKAAPMAQQEQEALKISTLCKKNNVLFLINDNIELAIKVNADGVHLGQSDTNVQQAREQLGDKIIGITCHNDIQLAQLAQQQGADYVAFGRFYSSQTKPSASPAELSILSEAKKSLTIPIAAIGGITVETAAILLNQGADMLAVVQGIFAQNDIFAVSQQFVEIIDSPKQWV